MDKIWFHADDFGVSPLQSGRILSCHREGVLNSISIIPNVNNLTKSLEMLKEEDTENKIRRVLHLNFVEGKPLCNPKEVYLLVDETGYFDKSFIKLLIWNYTKHGKSRKELKRQLKLEIEAQLKKVTKEYDCHISAVDSHQHYHMIPIVFDTLMEVLKSSDCNIEYIRIPVDPLKPILKKFPLKKKIPALNWIKWFILRFYVDRNKKILKRNGIKAPVFFGIFYTCEMGKDVVEDLLQSYISYADSKNEELELMFHPGNLENEYELPDSRRQELREFYMSDNRIMEAKCLKNIRL
jgi:predicted glycoside hydrolase/deacetylase ChbG (UPF0249 family)